jgi:hypothetical protein
MLEGNKIDIVRNNTRTNVTLDSVSTLLLKTTFPAITITNIVVQVDNTGNQSDVTVTVKDNNNNTLRHSDTGGVVVHAGKYAQITAVGNCWTVAEFSL